MMETCSSRTYTTDHMNVDTAMRFDVLIANMKITVLRGELPHSILESYQHLRGIFCPHLQERIPSECVYLSVRLSRIIYHKTVTLKRGNVFILWAAHTQTNDTRNLQF
jgi:hypothetical protein